MCSWLRRGKDGTVVLPLLSFPFVALFAAIKGLTQMWVIFFSVSSAGVITLTVFKDKEPREDHTHNSQTLLENKLLIMGQNSKYLRRFSCKNSKLNLKGQERKFFSYPFPVSRPCPCHFIVMNTQVNSAS